MGFMLALSELQEQREQQDQKDQQDQQDHKKHIQPCKVMGMDNLVKFSPNCKSALWIF